MNTAMIWQTRSSGSDDTVELGRLLGRTIKPPLVIELRSDLGGGKTTLVRGLAKGLDVKEQVTSPSFTLSREYLGRSGIKLYHFDFYRLTESGVLADQLTEAINDVKAIVVVEWSNIVQDVLPKQHITIEITPEQQNSEGRSVTIHYHDREAKVIEELQAARQVSKP